MTAKSFVNGIISIKTSKRNDIDKDIIADLINVLGIITALGAFFFAFVDVFIFGEWIHCYLSIMIGSFYILIPVINYFGSNNASRLYFLTICPLWHVISTILIGGDFSQEMVAASTLINSFILLDASILRKWIILHNIFLYIAPNIYVALYGPIIREIDVPFDEIIVFLISLCWILFVIVIYEQKLLAFIKSLELKNNRLIQKTNELERFNHIASHDLKSPLRSILSFSRLIKKSIDEENYKDINSYYEFIDRGANQMNDLINGILELSTIEKINHNETTLIDLNSILEDVKRNLSNEIKERNVTITSDELPSFSCHKTDFTILFQNLIQNGIKYNRSHNPSINISIKINKNQIKLSFTDNGIGIAEEYHDQVFEYFKRLHTNEEFNGTGLGLGICKKIVEKYGGKISIESRVGQFTTFHVILPQN